LGGLNFGRIEAGELEEVIDCATAFLLAVTEVNKSPTAKCAEVQRQNRRLGLDLMGLGEWFLQRGLIYGSKAIVPWLKMYEQASNAAADFYAGRWGLPRPVAVRSVAPSGTRAIVAETTSGIEPMLSPAYERRYLTPQGFVCETLVDPVAKRLYQRGIEEFETAYDISPDRRVQFQCLVQNYVDNAISSTINLPDTKSDPTKFGATIYPYLRLLRGMTAFPNGSRGLQPITPIPLQEALKRTYELEFQDNACPSGVCSV
jgi:ribonucleoside-diphosphate reductase alpha chain